MSLLVTSGLGPSNPTAFASGSDFYTTALEVSGSNKLRLWFSSQPLASTPANADDGLNPSNYSVSGPTPNSVSSVATVSGEVLALDLEFTLPLADGVWTVTASSSIETGSGRALQNPKVQSVTVTTALPVVGGGAVPEDEESLLKKHLSPVFTGTNWEALLAALAAGDAIVNEYGVSVFDQLFVSSASGKYLRQRASDLGQAQPAGVDIGDDRFRKLVIQRHANKLTLQALWEIVEVYYGKELSRAWTESEPGPWALEEGMALNLIVDGDTDIVFAVDASVAPDLSQVSALELAVHLNVALAGAKTKTFVDAVDDRIRIFSPTLGLGGSVKVTGGRLNSVLRFPQLLDIDLTGATITVTEPEPGLARYAVVGLSDPVLLSLKKGDYVNVFGDGFDAVNRGSFPVVDVHVAAGSPVVQSFDVANIYVSPQAGIGVADVLFFRPKLQGLYRDDASVPVLAQAPDNTLYVTLPATPVTARDEGEAAYVGSQDDLVVDSMTRDGDGVVTVTFDVNHDLDVGDQIQLRGARAQQTLPAVTNGDGSTTLDAAPFSKWSGTGARNLGPVVEGAAVTIGDAALVIGGWRDIASTPTPQDEVEEFTVTGSTTVSTGTQYEYEYNVRDPLPAAAARLAGVYNQGRVWVCGGDSLAGGGGSPSAHADAGSTVFHFSLDEGTGVDAADSVGAVAGLVLTDYGAVSVAGVVSGQRDFSGSASMDADTGFTPFSLTTFTIGFHYTPIATGNGNIIDFSNAGPSTINISESVNAGELTITLDDGVDAVVFETTGAGVVDGGGPYHIQLTRSGTNVALYVDGVPVTLTPTGTAPSNALDVDYIYIGASDDFYVDDFWCENIAYTAPQALAEYQFATGAGAGGFAALDTSYFYDVAPVDAWSAGPSLSQARALHTATVMEDASVLVCGGATATDTATDTAEILVGATITPASSMTRARARHQSILLDSGKVLVVGGQVLGAGTDVTAGAETLGALTSTTETYDPVTDTWAESGSMTWARVHHQLLKLDNGDVVVVGGIGYKPTSPSAPVDIDEVEVWDVGTGRWRILTKIPGPGQCRAVSLNDRGEVVVVGSTATVVLDTGTWSATVLDSVPGAGDVAANASGLIWAPAQDDGNDTPLPASVYVPASNTWAGAGVTGDFTVLSTPTPDSVTVLTPGHEYTDFDVAAAEALAVAATDTGISGPYVFDRVPGLTHIETTLTEAVAAGIGITLLQVTDTTGFDTGGGWLVLGFGTPSQTRPLPYTGVAGATALIMNFSYAPDVGVAVGASVTKLIDVEAFEAASVPGSAYATATAPARVAAVAAIEEDASADVNLAVDIVYPSDTGLAGAGAPETGPRVTDAVWVWGA